MIDRCANPNDKHYSDYGGRGIKVCDRWVNSVENFDTDMGERPHNMTLDRIDNDGNYEPTNCRWATSKEQSRNRRNNRLIAGKALVEWCEERNLKYARVGYRLYQLLKSGLSDSQAAEELIRSYEL